MIKSWFLKFFVLREREKWALTIIQFVFMTTNIHITELLYIWRLFALNYLPQNNPENQVGLALKSLQVGPDQE